MAAAARRRDQRIAKQTRNGHGTNPAGYRRDGAGNSLRLRESHVAYELGLLPRTRHPIDADIDNDGTLLDPGSAHEFRLADSGDQNIGAAQDIGNVLASGMNEGNGATLGQKQRRHRLADDVGTAKNDSLGAA